MVGMEVVTRYARSGYAQIAYQTAGEGPLDVLVVPRWFSNIELDWDLPPLARANDPFVDERHSRYAAAHIPGARYEVSARGQIADDTEQFLTGVRRPILSDRVLATVLFTDIVGSVRDLIVGGDRILADRGEHQLKGVPAAWRLFAV